MRAEWSGEKAAGGRDRAQVGSRHRSARRSALRRLTLEGLEARTLLATLPGSLLASVTSQSTMLSPVFEPNSTQYNVSNGARGDESSPSIAVSKNNPLKLVAVWTRNDPALPAPTRVIVEGAFSSDGGKTWNQLGGIGAVLTDPTTAATNPTAYPQVDTASVAFDRNDNFYVLTSQHQASTASNSPNALVLNGFNFSGGTPGQFLSNKIVYESTQDQALTATLAVDDNVASFTDTDSAGNPYTQTDPFAGNVYIAWATNDQPFQNAPSTFNPNRIVMVVSSNQGADFSGPIVLSQGGSSGNQRETTPQIAISQGRPRNTAVYGPGDLGVAGGQVTVVYDDFGTRSTASPPQDVIRAATAPGAVSAVFNGAGGAITDATSASPNVVTPTNFSINVNVTNPNFLRVSDLSVGLTISHPSMGDLTILLIPPPGSGLPTLTLVQAQGTTGGANFGISANGRTAETIFTDAGARRINDQNSTSPYMGYYRPQSGSFSAYRNATAAQINGTWTLQISDTRNTNVGSLRDGWSLNFLSGLDPIQDVQVTSTYVRGAMAPSYPFASAVTGEGIGPGLSLASDNTLGAFSPYQGRLYLAFTDRYNNNINPTDNSDIFLMVSDDGGRTWGTPSAPGRVIVGGRRQVNDDVAYVDGFSEGDPSLAGRPQFQPQVVVDSATGSVVLSFLDARNDAARARVATYIAASNDGGQTYAPQVYANRSQTAVDAITGKVVNLGPIPDNQSSGNPNTDALYGFGTHQGLAVYGGHIYPIWSSNENSVNDVNGLARLDIRTARMTISAGPRIIDSTMGAVGLAGDLVNPQTPGAPTPTVGAFEVTFDRPVDATTFLASLVDVVYRDTTTANQNGGLIPLLPPVLAVVPIPTPGDPANPNNIFGYTRFIIRFVPQTGVGTYSYVVRPGVEDRIRHAVVGLNPTGQPASTFNSTDVPKSIPDLAVATSTTTVSSYAPDDLVADISVNLTLDHTFDSDLILTLISPQGTRIVLSNRRGSAGQGYLNTTFSDSATLPIGSGAAPFTGNFKPESQLSQLFGQVLNGLWTLEVRDAAGGNAGNLINWSLSLTPGKVSLIAAPGNKMDQNANGVSAEAASYSSGPGQSDGVLGDAYAAPTPTNSRNLVWQPNTFISGPYDQDTLPLVVTGPHVVSSHIPGAPVSSDNLVLDQTVDSIDVVFDRNMDPASVTPASVLRLMGPAGLITGAVTIQANPLGTDPDPAFPKTYRIKFPTQKLNGTYTITLASSIRSAAGDQLDTNLNAGVALLKQTPTGGATVPLTFGSTGAQNQVVIAPQKTITSTIDVPESILGLGITLNLNINYPFNPDLEAVLIGPDGTSIKLFTGVGITGTQANFNNTVFDDSAATPIQNGGPPYFGRFKPQIPLSTFNGLNVAGTWTLQITNNAATNTNRTGVLNNWSLTFLKSVPGSGLGELVADQATVSYRIDTTSPVNPQAHNAWTSVGPASIASAATNGYSGQIGGIAVDPSDPSGNTVYVAGSSGGIWKTTNFLTTSANGPTYIPLTDFGPTYGLNIGSIAVFARNNDPNQSIIIAGTGFADSKASNLNTIGGNIARGVGFLRSMDGGATWTLLDSTNNNLPYNAQPGSTFVRDHLFAQPGANGEGTSTYKVVVDPQPTIDGNVIVYAALAGANGGLWRSLDTGQTWQKLSTDSVHGTTATDVSLNLNSAVRNAVSNPTGNVNVINVAFQDHGVYISPNRGQTLTLMAGNGFSPLIRDPAYTPQSAITVGAGTFPTNPGRIVLARPDPLPGSSQSDPKNIIYEGWLYAAVAAQDGNFLGLYLTKDNGTTWTRLQTNYVPENGLKVAVPSSDPNRPAYAPTTSSGLPNSSNYNIALTIDPTNPNIVYLGGTSVGQESGLLRVDSTKAFDSHAVVPYDGSRPDGGLLQIRTAGRVQVKVVTDGLPRLNGSSTSYLNVIQDPTQPFLVNSTQFLTNVNSTASGGTGFTNSGSGVTWIPFDRVLNGGANDFLPSTGLHRMIAIVDPLTGHARLIIGDDQGIFTGVDADGAVSLGIGSQASPTYSRNGNLSLSQYFYGAAQPSNAAASAAFSMVYGNGVHTSFNSSNPGVLSNGRLGWNASYVGETSGVGVQVDQQGRGIVYRYLYPGLGGNFTDFFQVSVQGGPFISRTTGLVQSGAARDPQWTDGTTYGNGLTQGNFTVNPLNGDQVIISSNAGRIFSTINQGSSWLVIAEPSTLDGTYAPALAFGAPDPNSPGGIGNLNNFIYAGTVGGKIFVTQTGGGTVGGGGAWTDVSSGLDGSPVVKIITNPTRGSHEAYAITQRGVYHTENSLATGGAGAIWTNITGNLFTILNAAFGDSALSDNQLEYLTSIVADWRYVIPDDPTAVAGTTHPVLYVSGDSGVYRSLDDGRTWENFPNIAFDDAPVDGGMLPKVHVTDLNLALGAIDPTTGRPVAQPNDPNNLFATTFGRGTFTIRLAPIVFPNTTQVPNNIALDPSVQAGTNAQGIPMVTPLTARPIIKGFSEQTAFGNSVQITLIDLTDPANPTIIGTGQTDPFGTFSVQVNQAAFTANGLKTIGVQATDGSGTKGNIATFQFVLQANNLGQPNPPVQPTIRLSLFDDSSGGQRITNITTPHILGLTDPNVTVELYFSSGGVPVGTALATGTSAVDGTYSLQFGTPLSDGGYAVQVKATNAFGSTVSPPLSFTIDTQGPSTAPSLGILAADDTGIVGDGVTSSRRPHFVGTTEPGAIVVLFDASNPGTPLAQAIADGGGAYSMQLPSDLRNGTIKLVARVRDAAGNQGPTGNQYSLTVTTVEGDYNGDGKADPALFYRTNQAQWMIPGVTAGTSFGAGPLDIPIRGDFNGDGKADLAFYRPSTAQWFVQGMFSGVQYGQAVVDIPVPGDYLGTGVTSIAIYRPTTGEWFIPNSGSVTRFGGVGDIPVPGDYDGVGHAQIAVYRPSTGEFFIAGRAQPIQVGAPGQIPVPGAYDNTTTSRRTEPAVFNPTTGVMTILGPNNQIRTVQFAPGSIPVPGDYDGLGSDEPAAYNPATRELTVVPPQPNSPRTTVLTGAQAAAVAVAAPYNYRKLPVAGDYLGVGQAQVAIFQRSDPQAEWFIAGMNGSNGIGFGSGSADIPLLGDFNGDGRADLAVYRPSTAQWFVQGVGSINGISFGYAGVDLPAPADYYGNGVATLGAYRPTTGEWFIAGDGAPITMGTKGGVPVPGDYDGDGKADAAVFVPGDGSAPTRWVIRGSASGMQTQVYGGPNDIPVPGDYDGVGHAQVAVFRPGEALWFIAGHAAGVSFGGPDDIPVPADYNGDGKMDLAVYRPKTGQLFIDGVAQPIQLGGPNAVPVNAPFVYRSLTKISAPGTPTSPPAAGGDPAAPPVVVPPPAGPSSTPPVVTPPQVVYQPPRPLTPKQARAAAKAAANAAKAARAAAKAAAKAAAARLRQIQLHDKALASLQGQVKPR